MKNPSNTLPLGIGRGLHLQQVYIVNHDTVANSIPRRMLAEVQIQTREFLAPSELLRALPLPSPACFLIDFVQPEMNGLQLMQILRRANAFQPCVFTSTRIEPALIVNAMNRGAFGFVKKPYLQIEFLEVVQNALRRDFSSHALIEGALAYRNRRDTLSSRERQILDMLEQGHPASKVGAHLRISPRTVENHRAQILQKLNLGNTTQLIRQVAVLDSLRASGILD
jgi:FixJ family two-component response regulator